MSRKKWEIPTAFTVALSLLAPNFAAASDGASDLAQHFATCMGRYAAQEDYDRLMGRDVTQAIERHAMFSELLDSVTPVELDHDTKRALNRSRVGASGAHWTLLHSADFSFDARLAAHAKSTATRNLKLCEMLVLG